MEWPINRIARAAGVSSRTLRHYQDVGLLEPSRIAANGYRYYDESCLVRLQHILLLRELGLGLTDIRNVLAGQADPASALRAHLTLLEDEHDRIERQIRSVRTTLTSLKEGKTIMAEDAFDGFDHARYKNEVIQTWGQKAYEDGARWWSAMSDVDKASFQQEQLEIARAFAASAAAGDDPDSERSQEITARHYRWLTRGARGLVSADYFVGLGHMYVDDPRFTANYDRHGDGTAVFVRDAMAVYARAQLT